MPLFQAGREEEKATCLKYIYAQTKSFRPYRCSDVAGQGWSPLTLNNVLD
jgi:hypothetical protein